MFEFLIKTILVTSFLLHFGCSNTSLSKNDLASKRGKELIDFIKKENYSQIYRNSASCMKSNYTEEEFVKTMKEAVLKLKLVDENLEFLDYDQNEDDLNDKWTTNQSYGIGYEEIKSDSGNKSDNFLLPKGKKYALILTGWQNDEDMKLTAFQFLLSENGKQEWYGTSSCKTTVRETTTENGKTQTKTTVLTDPLK